MNQKSILKHLLKNYQEMLIPYQDDMVLGKHYHLLRHQYDPTNEATDISEAINNIKKNNHRMGNNKKQTHNRPKYHRTYYPPITIHRRQTVDRL